jgi:UvrD/REP helicase N-terminal domain
VWWLSAQLSLLRRSSWAEILLALRPDGSGLTVVGDDAQSIYSFRAATVRNILDFPRSVSPAAAMIALEHNYRSTQTILDAANAIIAEAGERFAKTLYSTKQSAELPYLHLKTWLQLSHHRGPSHQTNRGRLGRMLSRPAPKAPSALSRARVPAGRASRTRG